MVFLVDGAGEVGTLDFSSAESEALEDGVREKALPRWVSFNSVDVKLVSC